MSQIKELLGKRIREIRLSRSYTQEKLAELTNIGTCSISKIESGIYHPTDENLEKIAKALGVQPYKLYMNSHNKDIAEIKTEILSMLDNASDEKLRLAYRVLNGLLD